MQVLRRTLEAGSDVVVIMLTGHGSVESAVEAMRAGAFDYLLKPLRPTTCSVWPSTARPNGAGWSRRTAGCGSRCAARRLDHVVGKSAAMEAVFDLVRKAPGPRPTS